MASTKQTKQEEETPLLTSRAALTKLPGPPFFSPELRDIERQGHFKKGGSI